jgi:transposase
LIPVKSGDRVKTNRRDAEKLARLYRSGELHFEHAAQEATFLDYLHELEHASERIARLERALERAIETAPGEMRALIDGVQALRGVSSLTAATIVAEVGPPLAVRSAEAVDGLQLFGKYRRLVAKGKPHQKAVIAVGRELLGFVWAIGVQVEKEQRARAGRGRAA